MIKVNVNAAEAKKRLAKGDGFVRRAIEGEFGEH
jgi:N-acetylmuramic acid 6-phosphate (MurNAc-6-P) etherase